MPPGALYTCVFDVMRSEGLPAELVSSQVVVSDPVGLRLHSEGRSGAVLAAGAAGAPSASSAQRASGGSSSTGCSLIRESEKRSALPYLFGAFLLLVGSVARR
jgi:hypothetical protein